MFEALDAMRVITIIFFLLPVFAYADSCTGTYEVKLGGVDLHINQQLFSAKDHHIEYHSGGIPIKIDGISFVPNDFDLPYCEVISISALFNGKEYSLKTEGLYDFWGQRRSAKDIDYVSCFEGKCRIQAVLGDAAGTYIVGWEFGGKASPSYLLSQDEGLIIDFLSKQSN